MLPKREHKSKPESYEGGDFSVFLRRVLYYFLFSRVLTPGTPGRATGLVIRFETSAVHIVAGSGRGAGEPLVA